MEDTVLQKKYDDLLGILKSCGSLAVAFSGGVDSTLLLYAAREALGDKVTALTACAPSFPLRESMEAEEFCRKLGISQKTFYFDPFTVPGFEKNPPDRCYLCKTALFSTFQKLREEEGLAALAEGSNLDDMGDYRPGLRAIAELGVRSPLKEAGLTKAEIRELLKAHDIPVWDKPSYACLASRFPYGDTITAEKLRLVELAEDFLLARGFRQLRVRMHGTLARLEVLPSDFEKIMEKEMREDIDRYFRKIGFSYVALDLRGYRTGSMNEGLTK